MITLRFRAAFLYMRQLVIFRQAGNPPDGFTIDRGDYFFITIRALQILIPLFPRSLL